MNSKIAQSLAKLFERHRIVFWYDDKQELCSDFELLALDDGVKQNHPTFGKALKKIMGLS